MKWSEFLIKIKEAGYVKIYNCNNDGLVEITSQEYDEICNFMCGDKEINNNEAYEDYQYFIKNRYIVDDDENEQEEYLAELKNDYNNMDYFALTILTTTACNFNCPYCYEANIDKTEWLDKNNAVALIEFLDKFLSTHSKLTKASVTFYGGEPTLNGEGIIFLLPRLDELFKKYGLSYFVSIVTNGYLLDENLASFMSNYNFDSAQITLDGTREVHDKRRKLHSGEGTFSVIINNVINLIEKDYVNEVDIRINIDKNNISSIEELILQLSETMVIEKIHLSLAFVTDTVTSAKTEEYIDTFITDRSDYIEYAKLYLKARRLGFKMYDFYFNDALCTAKMKESMIISPIGDIYKCESFVGRKKFKVGSIYNDEIKEESYLYFDLFRECFDKKCEMIPACNCGCNFQAYIRNGDIHSVYCKREDVIEINRMIMRLEHANEKK